MARTRNTSPKNFATNSSAPSSPERGGVPAVIMGPRLLLAFAVFALVLIGLVMVYSASSIVSIDETGGATSFIIKQLGFAVGGLGLCIILAKFIPYRVWGGAATWIAWGLAVFLVILTAAIGTEGLGAQRWVNIGPVSLQPAEFAKIAFVLMGARILFDYRNGALSPKNLLVQSVLLIIVPILFLYKTQSDLGTTVICLVGILAVMWIGEVPLKTMLIAIVALAVLGLIATFFVGYRADRLVFMDPWSDSYGTGYQLIHSFYAFSEGGLWGVGLGNSREKYLYLPEAETDFIFAIIGEELGLVGAVIVLLLFMLLLYAGVRIARGASDNFGAMIAGSFTVMIVFQAFLNIGCVIGLLPTTGKPLPFISSGGSALLASFIMVGLILSVSYGAQQPTVYDQRRADLRVVRSVPATPPRAPSRSGGGSKPPSASAGRTQTPKRGASAPHSSGKTRR
ncbi:MAG: putative lipid II flippase FtsW [Raoultibacter sp.]